MRLPSPIESRFFMSIAKSREISFGVKPVILSIAVSESVSSERFSLLRLSILLLSDCID